MGTQRVGNNLQAVVKRDFRQRLGAAQKLVFKRHHVVVKRLVGSYAVHTRVFFKQPVAQLALGLHLQHLRLQVGGISAEVFQENLPE